MIQLSFRYGGDWTSPLGDDEARGMRCDLYGEIARFDGFTVHGVDESRRRFDMDCFGTFKMDKRAVVGI